MELKHDHNSNLKANIAAKPLEVIAHGYSAARSGLTKDKHAYCVMAIHTASRLEHRIADFWFDDPIISNRRSQDVARIMAEQLAAKINRQS